MHDVPPDYLQFPADRTRVIFGEDAIEQLGRIAKSLGAKRALLVTDEHIVEAGHVARAERALETAHVPVAVFDETRENPTTEDVEACVELAQTAAVNLIIGLGGGSSLDTAKGCNFIYTNGGRMQDYWGVGKARHEMLPMIAVPTTAGTGSECQSFALIADAQTHQKMACGDRKALPKVAVLDPVLTVTQPRIVAADTGVDALTHAIETAVTTKKTETSLKYAHEAFKLISGSFERVFEAPNDLEARGRMMLAAAYAGTAIEHSMLGAAHAAANPLTAHFNVIHGQAVGLMLPAVIRHNAQDGGAAMLYAELAVAAGLVRDFVNPPDAVATLLERVEAMLEAAGLPRSLSEHNVPRDAIPTLAADAAQQWTGRFNPRTMSERDFVALYESVYEPAATPAEEAD